MPENKKTVISQNTEVNKKNKQPSKSKKQEKGCNPKPSHNLSQQQEKCETLLDLLKEKLLPSEKVLSALQDVYNQHQKEKHEER